MTRVPLSIEGPANFATLVEGIAATTEGVDLEPRGRRRRTERRAWPPEPEVVGFVLTAASGAAAKMFFEQLFRAAAGKARTKLRAKDVRTAEAALAVLQEGQLGDGEGQ